MGKISIVGLGLRFVGGLGDEGFAVGIAVLVGLTDGGDNVGSKVFFVDDAIVKLDDCKTKGYFSSFVESPKNEGYL